MNDSVFNLAKMRLAHAVPILNEQSLAALCRFRLLDILRVVVNKEDVLLVIAIFIGYLHLRRVVENDALVLFILIIG